MKKLRITVGGKSYDVTVEVLEDDQPVRTTVVAPTASAVSAPAAAASSAPAQPAAPVAEGSIVSPMAGTVKSVAVKEGDTVKQGQVVVVLDAMKMENQVVSPMDGNVQTVSVSAGDTVSEGQALIVIG